MQAESITRTDERVDALSGRVETSFAELRAEADSRFNRVEADIRELRTGQEALRVGMNAGNEALRTEMTTRFDRLQQTIFWFGGTLIVGFLTALIGGVVTAVLTGAF